MDTGLLIGVIVAAGVLVMALGGGAAYFIFKRSGK